MQPGAFSFYPIPAESSAPPLENPPFDSNPRKPYIEWNNRFIHINPSWYQKESVLRLAGKILSALGFLFTASTAYAAFAFKASPRVVIGTNLFLASGALVCSGVGLYCLRRNHFWHDPDYLKKIARNAVEEIQKKEMGLKLILGTYSDLIRNHDILNQKDLNILLYDDIHNLSYEQLLEKHGEQLLGILNSENLQIVRRKFIDYLYSLDLGVKEIQANFGNACINLQLQESVLISHVLWRQYKKVVDGEVSYLHFRNVNGAEALSYLDPSSIRTLKPKFLEEIHRAASESYLSASAKYARDCSYLMVSETELMSAILPGELNRLTSYEVFKERNGTNALCHVLSLYPDRVTALKLRFCEMPFQKMVSYDYEKDRGLLDISHSDIKMALKRDIESLNFFDFKFKHDLTCLKLQENGVPFVTAEDFEQAKDKFLKAMESLKNGDLLLHVADFKFFGISFRDYVESRLAPKGIYQILAEDASVLSKLFEMGVFKPSEWTERALRQCRGTFSQFFPGLKEAFRIGILRPKDRLEGMTSLLQRFNFEYDKNITLEDLLARWGEDLFEFGFLRTDSTLFKKLLVDYLSRNSAEIVTGAPTQLLMLLQRRGVVEERINETLNTYRSRYADLAASLNSYRKEILERLQEDKKRVVLDKELELKRVAVLLKIDSLEMELQESTSKNEAFLRESQELAREFERAQRAISDNAFQIDTQLPNDIQNLESDIRKLETLHLDSLFALKLEKLKGELDEALKSKEQLSKTTGLSGAFSAISETKKWDAEIERIEQRIAEIKDPERQIEKKNELILAIRKKIREKSEELRGLRNSVESIEAKIQAIQLNLSQVAARRLQILEELNRKKAEFEVERQHIELRFQRRELELEKDKETRLGQLESKHQESKQRVILDFMKAILALHPQPIGF